MITTLLLSCLAASGPGGPDVPVIVAFNGRPNRGLIERHGGRVRLLLKSPNAWSAFVPAGRIAGLAAEPEVAFLYEDRIVSVKDAMAAPPAAFAPPAQVTPWGVAAIGADLCWTPSLAGNGSTGLGVRVAVLDTGIDADHPDFADGSGLSRVVLGASFVPAAPTAADDDWHGTHVAGTIGASNNTIGVVGVAPECTLVAVKVLDSNGDGYYSWCIAGIDWAVADGCQVINMSLGGDSYSASLQMACDRAVAAGVVVVASAGNEGDVGNPASYPGAFGSVIAVGATDSAGLWAPWSTYGTQLDVAAPGVSIRSTVPTWLHGYGGYGVADGTSMAAPHVAGTAALIISGGMAALDDAMTSDADAFINDEIRARLESLASDINASTDPGWDVFIGHGRIDAFRSGTENLWTYSDPRRPLPPIDDSLADQIPPAQVTDLYATVLDGTTALLTWTVPGDDGTTGMAAVYDFRSSTSGPIDDITWGAAVSVSGGSAPLAPGAVQSMLVAGLAAGQTCWFAMRTADERLNWSVLSNNATTSSDLSPPGTVTTLAVARTGPAGDRASLSWIAPGDDDFAGTATAYEIRMSTTGPIDALTWTLADPIAPPTPRPGGATESIVIGPLEAGTRYWFALRAVDEAGNWSGLSNSPSMITLQ